MIYNSARGSDRNLLQSSGAPQGKSGAKPAAAAWVSVGRCRPVAYPSPMKHDIAPGPFLFGSANMAYSARSPQNFRGDLQHDVRDFMLDNRAGTTAVLAGEAARAYLAAAHLLDRHGDPVADCLREDPLFDLRTLWVAHDLLAAHWRACFLPRFLALDPSVRRQLEGERFCSYRLLLRAFVGWIGAEQALWCVQAPLIVRTICLILVQQNVSAGIMAEVDLFDLLHRRYRLPE